MSETGAISALDVRGLSKTFGGQRALIDFSLTIVPGEIHGLVGENGSGKSTFVKCLAGVHVPDAGGEIRVGGRLLPPTYGPQQAAAMGLTFVHQDLGLIPSLTVAANLFLGQPLDLAPGFRLRRGAEEKVTHELLTKLGRGDIDPGALIQDLSPASKAIVAVARCLHNADEARVVVFDEPTAPLAAAEVDILLDAVRRTAAAGHGVLYISHRLDEIFAITQNITILRDGRKVETVRTADTTRAALIETMLGRKLAATTYDDTRPHDDHVALEVRGLNGRVVKDASFTVHRGEIIGVAGLQGCGKSEIGRLLFGDQARTAGTILLDGKEISCASPSEAIEQGIALVPANRHRDGVHLNASVADNVTMLDVRTYFSGGRIRDRRRASDAQRLIEEYDVQPPQAQRLISTLSGGNQQKAVLAKWMHRNPRLLILDEPAQAIDVGAKARVFSMLQEAARAGMTVVIISEEFDDLTRLCDRILVMQEGRIIADLSGTDKSHSTIAALVYREGDVA